MSNLHPSDDPLEAIAQLSEWLQAEHPAHLVISTSGSSGQPKRVVLTRDAVLASVDASAKRLGARGQWLLALPASYVAGVQVMCRSLVAGHEPVVVEALDFDAALAPLLDEGRDVLLFTSLVPTQLHRLMEHDAQVEALRRLHTILLGGGPIDAALRAKAESAGLHIVSTYGASETAGGCVYDGLPLDGVELAVDEDGRLRVGGPTIFEEYAGDAALSEEAKVGGWFLTSDIARIDDEGQLHVLGRIDDVVVSGGVNVPLTAVARRLREHPEIDTVEVIGVPDDEWGMRVVAFVVSSVAVEHVSTAEARDWVGAEHSRNWAPQQVVVLDELPLLDNGKVDRQALKALA